MTMSRSFERLYPWIFGFAAGLFTHLMGITLPNDDSRLTALLSASISTSAILVGFLATIKAILMALPDSSIKTQLRDSGEMITLSSYLSSSMTANLIFCILNIGCFFSSAQALSNLASALWFAFGTFALSAFWRVGQIMILILRLV